MDVLGPFHYVNILYILQQLTEENKRSVWPYEHAEITEHDHYNFFQSGVLK